MLGKGKTLLATAGTVLSAMLSVTLTHHPVSTIIPAPAEPVPFPPPHSHIPPTRAQRRLPKANSYQIIYHLRCLDSMSTGDIDQTCRGLGGVSAAWPRPSQAHGAANVSRREKKYAVDA
jgi:hypothetical protein